jgi:hypothetical protein
MTFRMLSKSVAIVFVVLLGLCRVFAQSGQADVAGTVKDGSGATVPNAKVTLTNTDSGTIRSLTVQSDGQYDFPDVAPGHYSISVEATSFVPETVKGLTIELGAHVRQDISLRVGNAERIEVNGEVSTIDATANDVGGVITQSQMDTLPIANRQYLNLSLLLPGTTQDATRTFYNNVQSGGGGYYYANGFYLDGVNNTWAEQGEPRQNIPEGAVDQFQVYLAQFPAEFGYAMGGMTAVATKSGTNKIHGEVFEYYRSQALDADNTFQQQTEAQENIGKAPFSRHQYGGDIGGPIVSNRTHYYGAFERTQTNASYTIFVPSDYSANAGTFDEPSHDQMLTLRLDHELKPNQQVFVRYAQEWNLLTRQGCGGASTIYCYDGQIPRHSIVVGHTWEPTSTIVNDARFQYAYSSYELGPYGKTIPTSPNQLVSPAYTASAYTIAYSFPSYSYGENYAAVGIEKRWEVNDNLSIQRKNHSFKAGFDLSYVPYVDSYALNVLGTYTFATDQPFSPTNTANLTNPVSFSSSPVPFIENLPSLQTSYFGEDIWKIKSNLTANLGLRYDREYDSAFNTNVNIANNPEPIPFQGNPKSRGARVNFGPRIGLTWDPSKKQTDVIRIGYGIYYNNIQTEQNEEERNNFNNCTVYIANPIYGNPYGGLSPTSYCSTAPPTVTILAPNFRNAYAQQFTAGYSRQIAPELALVVDGVYEHGLRDYRVQDLNFPVDGVRPYAAFTQIDQHASISQTKYKGLFIRLEKRLSHRYLYTVSYTLSSGYDRDPQTQVSNYVNRSVDFGPSTVDRRNALVASGSVVLPWKITLGGIWTVRSTLPFSVFSGAYDADGTAQLLSGTTRDQGNRGLSLSVVNAFRAAQTGLNLSTVSKGSIDSSRYDDFDLRIERPIFSHDGKSLQLIGQAFNLFGTTNLLNANMTTNALSPSFGKITAANNVQEGEVAVKFTF